RISQCCESASFESDLDFASSRGGQYHESAYRSCQQSAEIVGHANTWAYGFQRITFPHSLAATRPTEVERFASILAPLPSGASRLTGDFRFVLCQLTQKILRRQRRR